SVVAYGRYEELADSSQWVRERLHAWSLLQKQANWWEPGGLKPVPQAAAGASQYLFYRIRIEQLTGRQALARDETMMPSGTIAAVRMVLNEIPCRCRGGFLQTQQE